MASNPQLIVSTPRGSVIVVQTPQGGCTAELEWAPGFGKEMTSQLQSGQARFDMEVLRLLEMYMQLDTRAMINSMLLSTIIGSGIIDITAPYSDRVYRSKTPVGRKTGPLRGPRHFDRMKADRTAYLYEFLKKQTGAK